MDIAKAIHLTSAVILLIAMFVLVKPEKLKKLWPAGLIAAVVQFGVQETFLTLHMMHYQKALFYLAGFPGTKLIDSFALGVLLVNYLQEEWVKKIPIILFFTIINEIEVYSKLQLKSLSFLNGFPLWIHFLFTFVTLSFVVWVSEGLLKKEIYANRERDLS